MINTEAHCSTQIGVNTLHGKEVDSWLLQREEKEVVEGRRRGRRGNREGTYIGCAPRARSLFASLAWGRSSEEKQAGVVHVLGVFANLEGCIIEINAPVLEKVVVI